MTDKYDVFVDGNFVTRINENFRGGISDDKLAALRFSHQIRYMIFQRANKTDNPVVLRELAGLFDELEFAQQELWGLAKDPNYHRWFDFPKCTCPKLDNEDLMGIAMRIINETCPIHGNKKT